MVVIDSEVFAILVICQAIGREIVPLSSNSSSSSMVEAKASSREAEAVVSTSRAEVVVHSAGDSRVSTEAVVVMGSARRV